ncbi:MAG: DUF2510 domain-containing protein [Propionibacteriales bacterium]|nr:DUF2510 domain-containing protein [Propionibacteriales bacterium]
MSTDVPEAAVDELDAALARNLAEFPAQLWLDTATAAVRNGGPQAAAQLSPGEPVEWVTPGILHRHGKTWNGAILMVTPHRLVVSASRGTLRTKREVSSLYRGPEALLGIAHRLLPGTAEAYWTLELATQQGPFLFAVPTFAGSEALARRTADFIARQVTHPPLVPAQRAPSDDLGDDVGAAQAGLEPVAALPDAGWYDDPLGEAALRYWDGREWTLRTSR